MKRVLFLAYLFPPIANSGTLRPLKFVKFLAEHGWDPIVITASGQDGHNVDAHLESEIPEGVRVIRVPMLSERIGRTLSTAFGGGALGKRVGDAVSWRMQQRRRSPDLYALWQPMAFRAAMQVFRETGFDAIYGTGFPWTTLLTGRAIAQATGCPFVADFRDLWAAEPAFRHERPPHEEEIALERSVVECAAAVVGASESISRKLATAHPSVPEDRFVAIHNGFDSADLDVAPAPRTGKRLRIAFTGVWKDGYNPSDLYRTIDWIRRSEPEALSNVEVVAAGFKPGEARRHGLAKYITEVGFVPHNDAVALTRSADLLYLSHVDPDRQWAVPGKLYEYLASGTPVLASTPTGAETARIIRQVGGGRAISPDDPGNLYHALLDACRGTMAAFPVRDDEALKQFERRHLAGRLAGVLNEVSSRARVAAALPRVSYSGPIVPRLRTR